MQTPMIAPRRAVLALAALLAAGCQDYNFNPVGHCLIAPARERVPLSNISTADVLFVVDDSGSMRGEQEALGQGFKAFIDNLDATNRNRVLLGQDPIDFHIAVTTTSVFYNSEIPSKTVVCRSDCPTASGNVCCEMTSSPAGQTPTRPYLGPGATPVACQNVGADCGAMQTKFRFDGSCVHGNATDGAPYPQGTFVGTAGAPRVLHFDKELYLADGVVRDPSLPPCTDLGAKCNRQGFTSAQLLSWFASQQGGIWSGNVIAGTCGSGEEQGLQAAQLALEKALAGSQLDTYDARGAAASVKAAWPHKDSKLVLVFLGDEDDCSSEFDPKFGADPSRGVIMTAAGAPGADACTADAGKPPSEQRRKQLADFVSYYTGLGRPVAAAFIVSTQQSTCADDACTPGICCPLDGSGNFACRDLQSGAPVCSNNTCGGQAGGIRLLETGTLLADKQVLPRPDVVKGSICDNDFDAILNRVAEIVKPPTGLTLPTTPASDQVAVLRLARPDGTTRKTCRGPAPAALTAADAVAQGYDWWFTATENQRTADEQKPVTVSRNVFINHGVPVGTGSCEANPGETYSGDYVGRLPEGGCQNREECRQAMSGQVTPRSWTCYAGGSQETGWTQPTPELPGTCVCGDLSPEYQGTAQDSW
jgi:hypothetical protein